jgi:hypothetical protein
MASLVEIESMFDAEVMPGLPGTGPLPRQFTRTGHVHSEGLVVRVRLDGGEEWIGNFQSGGGSLSGIWGIEGAAAFLVVAKGQGYWVNSEKPEVYQVVKMTPITDVRSIPELRILVLGGLTDIVAYGPEGKIWASGSVSWDGVRIVDANSTGITGIGWDAPSEKEVGFFLNPLTGAREGGSGSPA